MHTFIDQVRLRALLAGRLSPAELLDLAAALTLPRDALPFETAPELADEILRLLGLDSRPLTDVTAWLSERRPDLDLSLCLRSDTLPQLPGDLPDFVGRDTELQQIPIALRAGGCVLITGGGGMGKTALALHAAHRLADAFPDGRLVLDMRGVHETPVTPAQAMTLVILAFVPETKLPEVEAQLSSAYLQVLSGRRVLLILEDAVQAAQISPLLPPGGCGLIVTSRERILIPGVTRIDLQGLLPEEAVALLRAGPAQGAAPPPVETAVADSDDAPPAASAPCAEVDADALAQVAAFCGYVPLALRVAGSHLAVYPYVRGERYVRLERSEPNVRLERTRTAADLLASLREERARLLRLRVEDLDVGAVLVAAARRLVHDARLLAARWQALSVCPAPFDRAAAAAVWGIGAPALQYQVQTPVRSHAADDALPEWVGESLESLVGRGLLSYDADRALYSIHELLQPVARGVFRYAGEQDQDAAALLEVVRSRHAGHYLRVGGAANERYLEGGEGVLEGLRAFDAILPHLEAAWQYWVSREEAAEWISSFGDSMTFLLDLRLPPRRLVAILEGALAAARRLGDREAEGIHLGNLGAVNLRLGSLRRAIELSEKALSIAREVHGRSLEGSVLDNLGLAHAALGEARRAIEYYEEALAVAWEINDRRLESRALGDLGLAYSALEDTWRAIDYFKRALVVTREIGDRRGEGATLGNLGSAYAALGDGSLAIDCYEQALAVAREMGDRRWEGSTLGDMGAVYYVMGDARRGTELYKQALAVAPEVGDQRGEGARLGALGLAYRHLGLCGGRGSSHAKRPA